MEESIVSNQSMGRMGEHVNRNDLIALMLQDRSVARIISAPSGYGKTELAHEYAQRMFRHKMVKWVDANTPDFIAYLDERQLASPVGGNKARIDLLVLDGVPWLHEERAQVLCEQIDAALSAGVEVVVTCLPSNDCLRNLLSERMLIRARDLAVSQREFSDWAKGRSGAERVRCLERWRDVRTWMFGTTPLLVWGKRHDAIPACLRSFLLEKLPRSAFRTAFAIFLLQEGTFDDLRSLDAMPQDDDLSIFADDYVFLGFDMTACTFSIPRLDLQTVRDAIFETSAYRFLLSDADPTTDRVLDMLVNRGRVDRVRQILEIFYSDARCVSWLCDDIWTLLDRNELGLVETLLSKVGLEQDKDCAELSVIRAWTAGLTGDKREAAYHARKYLLDAADESRWCEQALSYLALIAFDEGGGDTFTWPADMPEESPGNALEFLCHVIYLIGKNTVCRAFCTDIGWECELEMDRQELEGDLVGQLTDFFTEYHDRFSGDMFYRLALHILCAADHPLLNRLAQRLGEGIVFAARRDGVRSYSEALLVRDLWNLGFFSLMGNSGDSKDMLLLQGAAQQLQVLSSGVSGGITSIPWDVEIETPRLAVVDDEEPISGIEPVRFNLFGSFEVIKGDSYYPESSWKRRTRNFLTLLVIYQGRSVPRATLFEQMWPELPRQRALDNFYAVWSDITRHLGQAPYLERSGEFCRINPRYVSSDVSDFEQISRAILVGRPDSDNLLDLHTRMEHIYRGGLAMGETESKMIIAQRERYRAIYIDSMLSGAEISLSRQDTRMALWFARKAMAEDQGREDVYAMLMRAQITAGQRCSAIKTYFDYRTYMEKELGLDISLEMQGLYDRLIESDPALTKIRPEDDDI